MEMGTFSPSFHGRYAFEDAMEMKIVDYKQMHPHCTE